MTPTPPLPPEDADVAAVRVAHAEARAHRFAGAEAVFDAALDRLAARVQETERERDDYKSDRDSYDDVLGRKMAERDEWHNRAETAERERDHWKTEAEGLASEQQVAEAAEAREAALREALERLSTKDFPLANRVYWMREFARTALATADPGASE